MTKTTNNRMREEMLAAAKGLHSLGIMNDTAHEKITRRHLGNTPVPTIAPISGDEIRQVREEAHLSQAVFARYLNVSPGYISQLERGMKMPTGAALALLNVIRRVGFAAIR
jgi:putative transcriptional regulator